MSAADKQIRVSDAVKRELDKRKRAGESYNDVLERVLGENPDTDFYDGFGMLSDEQADRIREGRSQARESRKKRMRRLSSEGE